MKRTYLIEPDEDVDRPVFLFLEDPVGDDLTDGSNDEEDDHRVEHP